MSRRDNSRINTGRTGMFEAVKYIVILLVLFALGKACSGASDSVRTNINQANARVEAVS